MRSKVIQNALDFLLIISNSKLKKSLIISAIGLSLYILKKRMSKISKPKNLFETDQIPIKKLKAKVDIKFFKKLLKLLKIAMPNILGRELLILVLLSAFLILRTILSIQISDVNGSIVKAIVKINYFDFIYRIIVLGFYAFPSSVVNSSLDYLNKVLGLCFRENLTKYYHEKYLKNMCFYQITNLDSRITNPDQIFTNDIEKWSYSLANLYSNFSKPLLDIVLFSQKISQQLGYEAPIITLIWYLFAGLFMRYISPPFGHLIAMEQSIYPLLI